MAVKPSLEDFLEGILPEKLDQPCKDDHLSEIALSLTDWQSIAPFLGLTEAEENRIARRHSNNLAKQSVAMLRKWRSKFKRKATYKTLITVLWNRGKIDLADQVCTIIADRESDDEEFYDAVESLDIAGDDVSLDAPLPVEVMQNAPVTVSLKDLLNDIPREKLDQPCRDDHLCEIALSLTNWQSIAPSLRISEAEEEEIKRDYPNTKAQTIGMLRKWKKNAGRKAKYRKLTKVFWKLKRPDVVEKVCEMLHAESCSSDEDGALAVNRSLDSYAEYLGGRYKTERPAFFTLQWPPPPTHKVFDLVMIRHETVQHCPVEEKYVRLVMLRDIDNILAGKTAVKLENIFSLDKGGRKVILIEGAPGCGKSTVAWHICQKWESRELFQQYKVVVFVQLRDPAIHSATFLADLLPARSNNMRTELQSIMEACHGRGVLFVLDGWDEFCPGLKHGSLFWKLISKPEDLSIQFSSLIITSRTIESGELQRYASSRVEIVGFTSAEVKKYFNESIGDSECVHRLHDHLRERPIIEASCYLPLNAAIIAHLFLALNHTLPHTLHEVFLSLVLCCIIRHVTRQADEGNENPDISSLGDLPPNMRVLFSNICTMAYNGVINNKAAFSSTDLHTLNLPTKVSTLSLIQGVQSSTDFDSLVSCNFPHISVQELLAAFHFSELSATEQVQIFNLSFHEPRLATVFRFYAAFTKLQTEGVKDLVARIVRKEEKPLLVNLLHCLYEAQDRSMCEFVASHLEGELDLQGVELSQMDCLAVGFFLSCVCLTTSGEFKVNLSSCSLGDSEVTSLIAGLSKCFDSTDAWEATTSNRVPGCLALNMTENSIHGCGIQMPQRRKEELYLYHPQQDGEDSPGEQNAVNQYLTTLDLGNNIVSDEGIAHISNILKTNTTLKRLCVSCCNISEKGGKAIGEVIMVNKSLQVLDLCDNPISGGVVHIAESLKHNRSLLEINLGKCDITEKEAESLGISLKENSSLQILILKTNYLSDVGAVHIAEGLRHNSCLKTLDISECGFGNRGMESLARTLVVNRSLEELNWRGNETVPDVVLQALHESLKRNRRPKTLNLEQNVSRLGENCHPTQRILCSGSAKEPLIETVNPSRRKRYPPHISEQRTISW